MFWPSTLQYVIYFGTDEKWSQNIVESFKEIENFWVKNRYVVDIKKCVWELDCKDLNWNNVSQELVSWAKKMY
jgi:hypothetical protein